MLKSRLQGLLAQTTLQLTELQISQLVTLVEQLDKWNKAYNLTSVRDPMEMMVKHILDSLVVSPHLQGERFIDVGTGPGLPGLPLAIINPDKQFVLLDSLGKRITFIRQVSHLLKLENVTAVQCRVEDYQQNLEFDGVISRAFASLQDMLSWCSHLPANSGKFYALKGLVPEQELENLPEGLNLHSIESLSVPELEGQRHLVIIDKNNP
ncbi:MULTISPECIES: 16S rRNA (guanine(527)-N(7))-methyltransferase RsmG [unclassified Agarivorans]|uniref:16S rRNA (guanine(527)-N(7))-methyltransferase RsmG n=1 Tax=unclassified Agarivorans TaxID=2636026 RepID=UPI0026E36652|nr:MULTISPECIES: 16S rRNA (guanine(527)-N(7))-methyltransferase RsmG [unclassified Agarivorans]MDO6685832.1 16S rRNA (guanine(527)-N(7))-methyltransferase RsmG [Agarivorans sp. 3_MG-2023]MDO6716053.1 16S rRNA (guanine(527)-N(7))-methyltransferase RsmG [Agarivorans sp. 2_MG-2023]MDO6764218.1 16S rRNA (guanine(527)-N(7))-methyltransferase RsmG [Agarivorans sp. 1_MG-2023]